jgi:hypothetical protein
MNGNQKHYVANHVATKCFLSLYIWQLKTFILDLCRPIDGGLISTIDLATKFGAAW